MLGGNNPKKQLLLNSTHQPCIYAFLKVRFQFTSNAQDLNSNQDLFTFARLTVLSLAKSILPENTHM